MGDYSRSAKVRDREPVRVNRADAAQRGIRDGDLVRIFNSRAVVWSARGSAMGCVAA